jgi:hypothetical protein
MKICGGLRGVVLKQGLYISKYLKCKRTSRNISVVKMMHGIKMNKCNTELKNAWIFISSRPHTFMEV